jgi:hypothetical protein
MCVICGGGYMHQACCVEDEQAGLEAAGRKEADNCM